MNVNYQEVPYIITGKDLDYLSDIFEWNIGSYKKTQNCIKDISNPEIQSVIEKASNMFYRNANEVLAILGGSNHE